MEVLSDKSQEPRREGIGINGRERYLTKLNKRIKELSLH